MGILSASIGYGLQRIISEILLGYRLDRFFTVPSCVIMFFLAVSDTYALVYSPYCSLLIFISSPVVWIGTTVSWDSRAIEAVVLVRVVIADCVD